MNDIENNTDNSIGQKVVGKSSSGGFQSLGLDKDILKGIFNMGYKVPTPVQRKSLPLALVGMDIVCMARTGSGKTLAFLIPMIQKLKSHEHGVGVRGIVLSPTRELAIQTMKFAKDLAKFTSPRIITIMGGDGIESEYNSLSNQPDILIATPGRLHHHLNEISTFKLKSVQYIVFDEADRLFEMGFAEQINEILKQCPIERQTLLFSATMPKALVQFSRAGLRDPQLVRLDTDVKMSEELRLAFFCVRTQEKLGALLYLVRQIIPAGQSTIIFTATKHHSEFIFLLLQHIGLKCNLIYGSMDQESRQSNLRSFRMGEVNFLIVTDLAARGIDIPLINNVINFHFPPTPKLFVHRCGRAARQGRLGYAFSLVEPEEMPYAVDVHRFLDIPVTTGSESLLNKKEEEDLDIVGNESYSEPVSYTLDTMLPSQIHIGLFPQDILDEEIEYVKSLLQDHESLSSAFKVSENAMKQYRRTRTAASHDGVKTTKKLVKNETIRFIHPLIQGMDPKRCDRTIVEKANFIRMLQTFRPAQTVLETGIGTGTSNTTKKAKITSEGKDHGVDVMRTLRRANNVHLERNRVKLSIIESIKEGEEVENAEEQAATDDDDDIDNIEDEFVAEDKNDDDDDGACRDDFDGASVITLSSKPRLSIAEKRKLKKRGYSTIEIQEYASQKALNPSQDSNKSNFRDPKFYMAYGTEDERATYAEESLQPKSGLRSSETQSAAMIENAMLDLTGGSDDLLEQNKNKKITHWDEKKRKFVKQTLSEMASSGRKGVKRLRSESGVSAPSKRKKGELYEQWKKKNNREIGVYDDSSGSDPYDNQPTPNVRVNTHVKDELKGVEQIRKQRKIKEKNKLKNMPKDKRDNIRRKMKHDTSDGPRDSYHKGTKSSKNFGSHGSGEGRRSSGGKGKKFSQKSGGDSRESRGKGFTDKKRQLGKKHSKR